MSRGAYDIGQYMVYFIVAAVLLTAPFLTLRSYTSQGFYAAVQEQHQVQDYVFSRYVLDCLAPHDAAGHVALGTIDLAQFTDERLRSCTSEPVSVTLQQSGTVGVHAIFTDPSLKQFTSFKTLRQETVLVNGKRSLLTVGVKDA